MRPRALLLAQLYWNPFNFAGIDASMRTKPEETTRVLDGLRSLVKVLREGSRAAEQTLGLSGAQLFVIKALAEAPSMSLNQLAARTRTHQSSVSVVVTRLVERGLVKRTQAADDGRRLVLELTVPGFALLKKAPNAAQDRLIDAIERLPARQRRALGDTLTQLANSMDLPKAAPSMFFEADPVSPRRRR